VAFALAVALPVALLGARSAVAASAADLDEPPVPAPSHPAAPPAVAPRPPAARLPAAPTPPGPPAAPAATPKPAAVASPAPAPRPAPVPEPSGPVPWPTFSPAAGGGGVALAPGRPPSAPPAPSAFDTFASRTKVGAYGQAELFLDGESNATARLPLAALSVEHRPSDAIRIAVAVQVEDGSTVGMQQALVEVEAVRALGFRAGLLIVPVGLGNLAPAPTSYLTVDRPLTDQLIVPSVWRELGVGIFGEVVPGLRYQGAVVSGLDGSAFSATAPLSGGRGDGASLAIHDAAVVGRIELDDLPPGLVVGGGGYVGGASHGIAALSGLRAGVVEADLRYHNHGLDLTAEYARLYVVNSYLANGYLGLLGQSAVPARGRGFYVQAGYDLLHLAAPEAKQELVLFAGYENVDARSEMSPFNYNPPTITGPGQLPPEAPSPAKQFLRGGIDYRPLPSVALKLDLQVALDGQGPPPAPPMVMAGAPGTPRPVGADVADAARGTTRVGLALAFNF